MSHLNNCSADPLIIWSSQMIKQTIYHQTQHNKNLKLNHFPRSYEITRKDFFYQRISRMLSLFGEKSFDFVPRTLFYPLEVEKLKKVMLVNTTQKGGNDYWIFKPCASSQGKGIFVTNTLDDVPSKQSFMVSEYLSNPLLINGFKFDLRLYVALTSVNPLKIYIYEEGLARFATEKYDNSEKNIKNVFAHLTNYSINKKNIERFVKPQSEGKSDESKNYV